MINLRRLIDLLPPYFKDKDTYKDENDQGILERFLSICGDYFKDDITPDIDSIMSLIDIDNTSEIYLNYIWELFGSIPFAYGILIDTRMWETYSKVGSNSDAWLKAIEASPPRARPRDILKYAIPLYKIRGTLNFYNILMGFYGYKCFIEDPTGDETYIPGGGIGLMNAPLYDDDLLYDTSETYDVSKNCLSCVGVKLFIFTEYYDVLDVVPEGKYNINIIDRAFLTRLYSLLNRFRPLNVLEFDDSNIAIYNRPPSEVVYDYDDLTGYKIVPTRNI